MILKSKGITSIWAVLVTVVIMLGLVGGGGYYWQTKTVKDKADLSKKIADLEKELDDLKETENTAKSATSKTTSESSLKTYTNKTYGYLFKYPANFSLIDYLYDTQTAQKVEYGKIVVVDKKAIAENALKNQSEIATPYFMVSAQSDLQFGLSELTSGLADSGGELSDVTVDGVAGWKIHCTQPSIMDETYSTSIYVNHGDFGITLSWKNSDAAGSHDTEIDTIVKSFKWL